MSLFPEMDEDQRFAAQFAEAWLKDATGQGSRAPWSPPQQSQRVLFSGMDCLPGQQNLFETDGQSARECEGR